MKAINKTLLSIAVLSSISSGYFLFNKELNKSKEVAAEDPVEVTNNEPDVIRETYIKAGLEPPACTKPGSPCMMEKVRESREEAAKMKKDYFDKRERGRLEAQQIRDEIRMKKEKKERDHLNSINNFETTYLDENRKFTIDSLDEIDISESSFKDFFSSHKMRLSSRIKDAHVENYKVYSVDNARDFYIGLTNIDSKSTINVPIILNDVNHMNYPLYGCQRKRSSTAECYREDFGLSIILNEVMHISNKNSFTVYIPPVSFPDNFNDENLIDWIPGIEIYFVFSENNEMLVFNELQKNGERHPSPPNQYGSF